MCIAMIAGEVSAAEDTMQTSCDTVSSSRPIRSLKDGLGAISREGRPHTTLDQHLHFADHLTGQSNHTGQFQGPPLTCTGTVT